MTTAVHVIRFILGLFLLLNGLNMWFNILPISNPTEGLGYELMHGLVVSGLFEFVKIIEIVTGLLLVLNRFVPLSLALMAPLVFVIVYVDFILLGTPQAIGFGVAMILLWGIPTWAYLPAFFGLFQAKTAPRCVSVQDLVGAVKEGK